MTALSLKVSPIKNLEWLFHILLWSFVISERWINHYPRADNFFLYGVYQTLILLVTFIVPIYLNAFILIPRFLKTRQWLTYGFVLVGMILLANVGRALITVLYFHFSNFDYNFSTEFSKWGGFRDFVSLEKFVFSPTSLILLISFAYRLIKDWIINEDVKSKLVSEKIAMELAFLKAQIDPHFLFNTLNNLYALSLEERAQKTSDAITKMGALMRYNLHDAQAERILLIKEMEYLEQYIELQKLRIVEDARANINHELQLENVTTEKIAPMILLPFIENAFKYGVSAVQDTFIEISLTLDNGILKLHVANTIREEAKVDQGGIGLKNVRNRLELIYPQRHTLSYLKEKSTYVIDLELDLKDD
jgi:two-component system, LytTR family, sensor kinase